MDELLKQESEKLARSWMQHDPAKLRDYLVAGVEDPRINVQSVLSRHFLVSALFGEKFLKLAEQELRFACVMNWLLKLTKYSGDLDERRALLHALKQDADNAEGLEVPTVLRRVFKTLPAPVAGLVVPNYIETALTALPAEPGNLRTVEGPFDTFMHLWRRALVAESCAKMSVLEPACGSANDYRFLESYGLAKLIDYAGFDLCEKNAQNASAMFPQARFAVGNVFEIGAADNSFDFCFVHDLFEHLSLEGLEAGIKEVCRVTRRGLCVGFFNADEIPEHIVRPVDEYHWNTLSVARLKQRFAAHGFDCQVIHIGSLLKWRVGWEQTHNSNAYTFVLNSARQPFVAPATKGCR